MKKVEWERGRAYVVTTYNSTGVHIETDHVACCHKTEVPPERVHPDVILELRVADADVPGLAFGEPFACKVAEGGGCVDEDVFAVLGGGGEGWDACWG